MPVPVPGARFVEDMGGGQQCFVFLYKTNDVSQTHEPRHASPVTATVNTDTNTDTDTDNIHTNVITPMPMV